MTDRPAQSAPRCKPWCGTLTLSHAENTEHGPGWVTSGGTRPTTMRCWCNQACKDAGRPLNPAPPAPPVSSAVARALPVDEHVEESLRELAEAAMAKRATRPIQPSAPPEARKPPACVGDVCDFHMLTKRYEDPCPPEQPAPTCPHCRTAEHIRPSADVPYCCFQCGGGSIDGKTWNVPARPCTCVDHPAAGCQRKYAQSECTAQAAPDGERLSERMRKRAISYLRYDRRDLHIEFLQLADAAVALEARLAAAEREAKTEREVRETAIANLEASIKYRDEEVAKERARCQDLAVAMYAAIRDGKPAPKV